MNNRNLLIPIGGVSLLIVAVAWMAGSFDQKVPPGLAAPVTIKSDHTLPVRVIDSAQTEAVAASVSAKQATLISARILARITRIHVRSGDPVTKGQLLVELEDADLVAREAQAQQQINAISARLQEARTNLERTTALQQKGLVANADLDRATANFGTLNAELKNSQRALEEAQATRSYTAIRAPIDGRVIDRFAEPGDTATPGSRLLSLYNPLSLRIEAPVRESLALALQIGQTLNVEIPALQQQTTATIEEVVPAADPGSRSFQVKAALDYNPALLPGMYARLYIPAGSVHRRLLPSELIQRVGQLNVVAVYHEDGIETRYIKTGDNMIFDDREYTDVISGLEDNDRIMLNGGDTINKQ